MSNAVAKPFVLVAAVLQAARLDAVISYKLPRRRTEDCFEHTTASSAAPDNLSDTIDALQKDTLLPKAVGQMLVDNQVFMKRAEVGKTEDITRYVLRDQDINHI